MMWFVCFLHLTSCQALRSLFLSQYMTLKHLLAAVTFRVLSYITTTYTDKLATSSSANFWTAGLEALLCEIPFIVLFANCRDYANVEIMQTCSSREKVTFPQALIQ